MRHSAQSIIYTAQKQRMFIYVTYKDAPELSTRRSSIEIGDSSVEKSLLVNPDCFVRIMLEYIRKKCRLGSFTQFDLCDESGLLMGLFTLNTYAYATERFEHKKIYYVIVLKPEMDKQITVLPQLNQENKLYAELQLKVTNFLATLNEQSTGAFLSRKSVLALSPKVSPQGKEKDGSIKGTPGRKKTRVGIGK